MTQQNLPVMSSADQDLMRNWANTHGKCVRQRIVRQETTKYKAGTLPLNMYQTAVHRGEQLEFAPVERVEQPEFAKEEGREGAPTTRDPGDNQLSEYNDNSSDDDSDDFAVEEDGAIHDMQNEELGFLFASRRTRSGQIVKTTIEHSFALDIIFQNDTVCNFCLKKYVLLFSVKREMPILFFVNCERTILFSLKRDLNPPPPPSPPSSKVTVPNCINWY